MNKHDIWTPLVEAYHAATSEEERNKINRAMLALEGGCSCEN